MSFDSGTVSFRFYDTEGPIDGISVEQFAAKAAPPVSRLGDAPISGWVSPRFLLDTEITEETMCAAGWFHGSLLKAVKKIPPKLLKTYCRMSEYQYMRDNGIPFVNSNVRREIKQGVTEQLLPQMPPTLSGISFAASPKNGKVFADALSIDQDDAFRSMFRQTTDVVLHAMTPEEAAMRMCGFDYAMREAVSFSPDPDAPAVKKGLGLDFFTWLWYYCDTNDGLISSDGISEAASGRPIAFVFEGPATFVCDGAGALEASVRKGTPMQSLEAQTALQAGKKLSKAKIRFGFDDENIWSATVDAQEFVFRSVKLPRNRETPHDGAAFEENMLNIMIFTEIFYGLFRKFISIADEPKDWKAAVKGIREWVGGRLAKI